MEVLKLQHVPLACSLLDLVPTEHLGTPRWYISHASSGQFQDLVTALKQELVDNPWREHQRPQDIMVWIGR